jgi:hypothetical protein
MKQEGSEQPEEPVCREGSPREPVSELSCQLQNNGFLPVILIDYRGSNFAISCSLHSLLGFLQCHVFCSHCKQNDYKKEGSLRFRAGG